MKIVRGNMKIDVVEALCVFTNTDKNKINENTDLIHDLKFDSLSFFLFVQFLEDKYGLQIPEEDIFKFRTVGDIQNWSEI